VADDVPVYYFRTHFSLPSSLSQITELHLRTFVDDFAVLYLNNDPTPFHSDMGNGDPDVFHYGYSGGTAIGDANFLPATSARSRTCTSSFLYSSGFMPRISSIERMTERKS
jgi:hypothetical protein